MKQPTIVAARKKFHQALLATCLTVDDDGIPSNADKDNNRSKEISKVLSALIGNPRIQIKAAGQTLGKEFEECVTKFIDQTFTALKHLRPVVWRVLRGQDIDGAGIAAYDQYSHLSDLKRVVEGHPNLKAALGSDYIIQPDIVLIKQPFPDDQINSAQDLVNGAIANLTSARAVNGAAPTLHANISCQWTIRSDRSQNTRSEALNLIRNRKGRLPHVVAVTAEPVPNRLASIALGTGDIDCVYHFALKELQQALTQHGNDDASDLLKMMVDGKRLRDIADLPLDLII